MIVHSDHSALQPCGVSCWLRSMTRLQAAEDANAGCGETHALSARCACCWSRQRSVIVDQRRASTLRTTLAGVFRW